MTSVLANVLSIIVPFFTVKKLKKEEERLDTMLSYCRLVHTNKGLDDNVLAKTKNAEILMRKEYANFVKLCEVTNEKKI